jgi:translation initiation factor IF-1
MAVRSSAGRTREAGEADETGEPGVGRRKERVGTVRAVLPRALYRVELDGGREITAHAPSGPGRNFVRLIEGDRVDVALVARDAGRARIIRKVRKDGI